MVLANRRFNRRPVVGVLASGDDSFAEHSSLASRLGEWIAREGHHLLVGGGGGLMAAVSRAYYETPERAGQVIGVIPGSVPDLDRLEARDTGLQVPVEYDVAPAYPNPWVEIAIFTHLPLSGPQGTHRMSRNHVNVLSADVLVGLPGRAGTFSELWLARYYGVPAIAYHPPGLDLPVPAGIPRTTAFDEVVRFVREHLRR